MCILGTYNYVASPGNALEYGGYNGRQAFKQSSAVRKWIARAIAVILAVYGVYAFIKRQIGDYLLMKMHFVFYDYTESVLFFMADYLAVMILIAFIGYYAGLLMKKYKTR